jgi:hypothetical protein
MAPHYFFVQCGAVFLAARLGWRSRCWGRWSSAVALVAALAGLGLRGLLHVRPEVEQHLLCLSQDYPYFSAWDAPLAGFVCMALAARLGTARLRQAVLVVLALVSPLLVSDAYALCLRPPGRLRVRLARGGIYRPLSRAACAPAAALTLLHQLAVEASPQQVARACFWRRGRGLTAVELCAGLDALLDLTGRRATIRRLGTSRLPVLPVPFLAEVRRTGMRYHCVVVLWARDGRVELGDPAQGRYACMAGEFLADWTGLAITIRRAPPAAGE